MNQPSAPTLAWKSFAAAGALLAAVHGAHAATPAQDATQVDVDIDVDDEDSDDDAVIDVADLLDPDDWN